MQKLIVAGADLFARLTREWSPPDCVAQELLVRVLFDHVQFYKDTYGLDLAEDWRSTLARELLVDPGNGHSFGSDESDADLGRCNMTSVEFENWFEPFDGRRLPLTSSHLNLARAHDLAALNADSTLLTKVQDTWYEDRSAS